MKPLHLIFFLLLFSAAARAQQPAGAPSDKPRALNLVKFNVTAPILKNYALQYERIINKRISVALSGRLMPATNMPLKTTIKREVIVDDNPFLNDIIDQAKVSNVALTPEMRVYLGKKGFGHGFYVGPYYRFATYKLHETMLSYEVDAGQNYDLTLSGDLTSHTAGLLIGAQWHVGKHFSIDLWIAGPSIGGASGHVIGVSGQTIPAEAQQELRSYLEDIDLPFVKETITVNANGGRMDLGGSWAGIRTGVLAAFRF
ncbi:DUF3575 domain-containing protein [Niabella insulamsoli]|uniref:DUF3575 domain-containing protein n=1 Tax=Niabella insulamsoli TaxID=3144874 RepID=UPI0031FDBA34